MDKNKKDNDVLTFIGSSDNDEVAINDYAIIINKKKIPVDIGLAVVVNSTAVAGHKASP